ncbi:MAG: glutamine synthetase III, partial [Ruminiclostridium sp.]|nr:glutamine synthetase III [Ruminiclostridium sp.]
FSMSVMRERLPKKAYTEVVEVMEHGGNISMATADIVANAMKDWAVEKGATHFTHWFQPLTGVTAEKHDSFLTAPQDSKTLLQLTGKQLIMGEPDASSFPSGGLRATHYARGYTAWDMTSPAFVKEMSCGTILCIPTIFVSYNGEALDKKTPLLRSMEAINTQALRILRLFGRTDVSKVIPSVGAEQEYFLVDREKYLKRRDLIYPGRTLFGAPAPKGQELDDQYFGVIRYRVGKFMADVNQELWKLGIPATTQHNEAAPAQHELAPVYTPCHLSVDQNQLVMETMKRVATRHGLVCLFHEKPYAGVNGSGKHNNWSIGTDMGENLLDPGDAPHENLQFLLILSCIMQAVDRHADLLRCSASCAGNEHRLGGQEAPPAIISMFLGDQLEHMIHQIVNNAQAVELLATSKLDSGVSTVPVIKIDATDRNRTTPFAFTGNKFEFRMVGSSDSIADANVVLNAIVAEALCEAADVLEGAEDFNAACAMLIKDLMTKHRRILFNGNGYSHEWVEEAKKRGLPILNSMVDAIPALTTEKAEKVFTRFGIYTKQELESRAEIMYETYVKVQKIEANTMIHMAAKHFVPTAIRYTTRLGQSIGSIASACPEADVSVQKELLVKGSNLLKQTSQALENLKALVPQVDAISNVAEMANAYHDQVVPAMAALRKPVDELEMMVDKEIWPVPTYGDLMFEV